jgi:hypothetical protein
MHQEHETASVRGSTEGAPVHRVGWLPARVASALAAVALTCFGPSAALQGPGEPAPQRPIVRVFLLAGQSNMEGHGVVDLDDPRDYNGGRGSLAQLVANPAQAARWAHLHAEVDVDGSGARGWATRDDVFVSYLTARGTQKAGPLSVGFAVYDDRHHFGPELGLGHVLGESFAEPVLLVKTAWGGKSLARDFRPPSAGGTTGPYYVRMLAELNTALVSFESVFPALAGHTAQLDGVVWFQGWNDGCDDAATAEYESNLVHLIADVRAALGDAALPFVVGETGNMDNAALRAAQAAACARPEVGLAARFVPTRTFLRAPEDSPNTGHGHHWFGNGESYLLIGDALGHATAELLAEREVVVKSTVELRTALAAATPGQRVLLAPGEYQGFTAAGLRGAPGAPIVVRSADPTRPARFVGGVHLSRVAHVELAHFQLERAPHNGLNIDDGGTFDQPSRHVVLRGLAVRDCGGQGNEDGIKLSGVEDLLAIDCTVERWGRGGSGFDLVGCHRCEFRRCVLRDSALDSASSGIQVKGGSSAVAILGCRFEHAGQRAVHLGGSTGLQYFRPPVASVSEGSRSEARDLRVEGCTFIGSQAPVTFVGVDGASVRWNTLYLPAKWVLRILQETTAPGFVPCRNGVFADNLVVYTAAKVSTAANVGPHTAPNTFVFARNRWLCLDDPSRRPPRLPMPEEGGVSVAEAPFVDAAAGDLRFAPGAVAAAGAEAWPGR